MLDISSHMLESARNENWEEVDALQVIRAEMIEQIFSHSIDATEIEFCARVLQKTIDINQALTRICQSQREGLSQAVMQMRHGQKLKKTYDNPG